MVLRMICYAAMLFMAHLVRNPSTGQLDACKPSLGIMMRYMMQEKLQTIGRMAGLIPFR